MTESGGSRRIDSRGIEQGEEAHERDDKGSENDLCHARQPQGPQGVRASSEARSEPVAVEGGKRDHYGNDGDLPDEQRPVGVEGGKGARPEVSAILTIPVATIPATTKRAKYEKRIIALTASRCSFGSQHTVRHITNGRARRLPLAGARRD